MKLLAFVLLAVVATVFCDGNSSEESDRCQLTPNPTNRDKSLQILEAILAQCITAPGDVDLKHIAAENHTAEEVKSLAVQYCNAVPDKMAECSSYVHRVAERCINETEKDHLRATSDFLNLATHVGCEDNARVLVEFVTIVKSGQNVSSDFKEMSHCVETLGEKYFDLGSAETCGVDCFKRSFYAAFADFQKCVDDIEEDRPIIGFMSSLVGKLVEKMVCSNEDGSTILCKSLVGGETAN